MLPVKGSAAAQERKQLLQKQIPIHDIDPTLCHELTDKELKQMNEYIAHVKQNSVGMGHVIQLGMNRVANPQILNERCPLQVSNTELVKLTGAQQLSEKLQNLQLGQKGVNNLIPKSGIRNVLEERAPSNVNTRDIHYTVPSPKANYPVESLGDLDRNLGNLPHYAPSNYNRFKETREPMKIGNIRDLAFSTYDPKLNENSYDPPNSNLGDNNYVANSLNLSESEQNPTPVNVGGRILTGDISRGRGVNFVPNQLNLEEHEQNPKFINVGGRILNDKMNFSPNAEQGKLINYGTKNFSPNAEQLINSGTNDSTPVENLSVSNPLHNVKCPNYAQNTLTLHENCQNPEYVNVGGKILNQPIGNISAAGNIPNSRLPHNYTPNMMKIPEDVLNPTHVNIGAINDVAYPTVEVKRAVQHNNEDFEYSEPNFELPDPNKLLSCHRCKKNFEDEAIVVGIDRSDALFHSSCFKCAGCNQNLADLVYFYHADTDEIYCGRDYAKIRGIPRCKACDELIFVKEYCLAENSTFHVKHFCCFECDTPLAGQDYVVEDAQPVCLPCFEKLKADKCNSCLKVIKPDEQGANLNGVHFHATDECFACKICRKPLLGSKLLLRNNSLYCSGACYAVDK